MGDFRPPWEPGPAEIVKSRSTIVRSWAIFRHVDGGYIGVLIGGRDPLDEGPDRTTVGALSLVKAALERREVRQGLPIVMCDMLPVYGSDAA